MSPFLGHRVQDNASLEKQGGLPKAISLAELCVAGTMQPWRTIPPQPENFFDVYLGPDMVAHACNLSTWKAELCRSSKRTQAKVDVSQKQKQMPNQTKMEKKRQKQTNKTPLGFQSTEVSSGPNSVVIQTCTTLIADKLN